MSSGLCYKPKRRGHNKNVLSTQRTQDWDWSKRVTLLKSSSMCVVLVDSDISMFLDQNLETIIARMLGLQSWLIQSRENVIEALVCKAASLYLWAAIACHFISKRKPLLRPIIILFRFSWTRHVVIAIYGGGGCGNARSLPVGQRYVLGWLRELEESGKEKKNLLCTEGLSPTDSDRKRK